MSRYQLSRQALHDLDAIVDYYTERGEFERLVKVVDTIRNALKMLAVEHRVRLGHLRDDLTSEPLLFYTVGRYAIIYRLDRRPAQVVRILNHARDIRALLTDQAA